MTPPILFPKTDIGKDAYLHTFLLGASLRAHTTSHVGRWRNLLTIKLNVDSNYSYPQYINSTFLSLVRL